MKWVKKGLERELKRTAEEAQLPAIGIKPSAPEGHSPRNLASWSEKGCFFVQEERRVGGVTERDFGCYIVLQQREEEKGYRAPQRMRSVRLLQKNIWSVRILQKM